MVRQLMGELFGDDEFAEKRSHPRMASAAEAPVPLGTATSFAVLSGGTVTSVGASSISGDLGVGPGTAITGFPPGLVAKGVQYAGDATALQAQADLTTGYNAAAASAPSTSVSSVLSGQTLAPGVYRPFAAFALTVLRRYLGTQGVERASLLEYARALDIY